VAAARLAHVVEVALGDPMPPRWDVDLDLVVGEQVGEPV